MADDEADLRRLLEVYLRRHGFNVLSAENIAVALQLLDHWSISVAVVDIKLGASDGYALVDAIHRWHRGISVVLLTGAPDGCAEAHARKLPCIQKGEPGSLRDLVSVLRAVLGLGPHG